VSVASAVIPWLTPAGLGIVLGRIVGARPSFLEKRVALIGGFLVATFIVLRAAPLAGRCRFGSRAFSRSSGKCRSFSISCTCLSWVSLSWFFRDGTSFGVMYLVWPAALAAMYPACGWYARFKAGRPIASIWRLL
jgi:hypothetical protein